MVDAGKPEGPGEESVDDDPSNRGEHEIDEIEDSARSDIARGTTPHPVLDAVEQPEQLADQIGPRNESVDELVDQCEELGRTGDRRSTGDTEETSRGRSPRPLGFTAQREPPLSALSMPTLSTNRTRSRVECSTKRNGVNADGSPAPGASSVCGNDAIQ